MAVALGLDFSTRRGSSIPSQRYQAARGPPVQGHPAPMLTWEGVDVNDSVLPGLVVNDDVDSKQ